MVKNETIIKTKDIDFNEFNPNQMTSEKYSSLKESIKKDGIQHPVIVRPKGLRFEMLDGENRTKIAKELRIKELRAIVKIVNDTEAMRLCYKVNSDRGTIDCFKEAIFFDILKQKGIKDKDSAKEYGFSAKFIQDRRRILSINNEQKELLIKNFPKGKEITGAHWVEYAKAAPETRILICKDISHRYEVPVKDITESAKRAKEKIDEIKRFEKMLKEAKVKECPVCKKLPVRISYYNKKHLSCENYHDWHPSTGKTDQKIIGSSHTQKEKKKKAKYPRNLEIKIDWAAATKKAQETILKKLKNIKNITFEDKEGKTWDVSICKDKGYEDISLCFDRGYTYNLSVRDPRGDGKRRSFIRGPQYNDIDKKIHEEMLSWTKFFNGEITDKRMAKLKEKEEKNAN